MMKRIHLLSSVLIMLSALNVHAQVVINEYSCGNLSMTVDNYNSSEGWIELYNTSFSPVDIGNYYLSDKVSQPTKWQFPPSVIINGNSHLIIWASGRNEAVGGNYHTNFHLTQTKFPQEHIVFSDATGAIIEQQTIQVVQLHNSIGRNPDGGT